MEVSQTYVYDYYSEYPSIATEMSPVCDNWYQSQPFLGWSPEMVPVQTPMNYYPYNSCTEFPTPSFQFQSQYSYPCIPVFSGVDTQTIYAPTENHHHLLNVEPCNTYVTTAVNQCEVFSSNSESTVPAHQVFDESFERATQASQSIKEEFQFQMSEELREEILKKLVEMKEILSEYRKDESTEMKSGSVVNQEYKGEESDPSIHSEVKLFDKSSDQVLEVLSSQKVNPEPDHDNMIEADEIVANETHQLSNKNLEECSQGFKSYVVVVEPKPPDSNMPRLALTDKMTLVVREPCDNFSVCECIVYAVGEINDNDAYKEATTEYKQGEKVVSVEEKTVFAFNPGGGTFNVPWLTIQEGLNLFSKMYMIEKDIETNTHIFDPAGDRNEKVPEFNLLDITLLSLNFDMLKLHFRYPYWQNKIILMQSDSLVNLEFENDVKLVSAKDFWGAVRPPDDSKSDKILKYSNSVDSYCEEVYAENLDIKDGVIRIRWFNNCSSRHVDFRNGDKVVIHCEKDICGANGSLTCNELLQRVSQLDIYLKESVAQKIIDSSTVTKISVNDFLVEIITRKTSSVTRALLRDVRYGLSFSEINQKLEELFHFMSTDEFNMRFERALKHYVGTQMTISGRSMNQRVLAMERRKFILVDVSGVITLYATVSMSSDENYIFKPGEFHKVFYYAISTRTSFTGNVGRVEKKYVKLSHASILVTLHLNFGNCHALASFYQHKVRRAIVVFQGFWEDIGDREVKLNFLVCLLIGYANINSQPGEMLREPTFWKLLRVISSVGFQITGSFVIFVVFVAIGFMSPVSQEVWRLNSWSVACFFRRIIFIILIALSFICWGNTSIGYLRKRDEHVKHLMGINQISRKIAAHKYPSWLLNLVSIFHTYMHLCIMEWQWWRNIFDAHYRDYIKNRKQWQGKSEGWTLSRFLVEALNYLQIKVSVLEASLSMMAFRGVGKLVFSGILISTNFYDGGTKSLGGYLTILFGSGAWCLEPEGFFPKVSEDLKLSKMEEKQLLSSFLGGKRWLDENGVRHLSVADANKIAKDRCAAALNISNFMVAKFFISNGTLTKSYIFSWLLCLFSYNIFIVKT